MLQTIIIHDSNKLISFCLFVGFDNCLACNLSILFGRGLRQCKNKLSSLCQNRDDYLFMFLIFFTVEIKLSWCYFIARPRWIVILFVWAWHVLSSTSLWCEFLHSLWDTAGDAKIGMDRWCEVLQKRRRGRMVVLKAVV